MLDLLNLIFLAGQALANIVLFSTDDVKLPPLGGVVQVSFREEAYTIADAWGLRNKEKLCIYSGIAVPYARTWEESVTNLYVESVLPPEPDKIAGYALLINKKQCPGKEAEPMFRVATLTEAPTSRFKGTLAEGWHGYFQQVSEMKEEQRPKWFAQVSQVVDRAAEANPVAKTFMDEVRQANGVVGTAQR